MTFHNGIYLRTGFGSQDSEVRNQALGDIR